jgi:CRISPR/Cas system CSM-associated protein Csm3 (group 7 of RAMP superfamily)
LRGTALAGVLRTAYTLWHGDEAARRWFGDRYDENQLHHPSVLKVPTCRLQTSRNGSEHFLAQRTHNLIDRHRGVVVEGGLFSLEACPPGTLAATRLWMKTGEEPEDCRFFLTTLAKLFELGLTVGGSAARGIGLAELTKPCELREYNLSSIDDHAQWLQDRRNALCGACQSDGAALDQDQLDQLRPPFARVKIQVRWGIPRGQDILVADGTGMDHDAEPKKAIGLDGEEYWHLPGSALRGPLRSWMARHSAVGAQEPNGSSSLSESSTTIADRRQRYEQFIQERGRAPRGNELGWLYEAGKDRRRIPEAGPGSDAAPPSCATGDLFGSLFRKGRIHVADAFAKCEDESRTQVRQHVAIDAVTGGTQEGLLFDGEHLLPGEPFLTTILVDRPNGEQLQRLAAALVAVDQGLIRVGSSKASGRLSIVGPVEVTGNGGGESDALARQFLDDLSTQQRKFAS